MAGENDGDGPSGGGVAGGRSRVGRTANPATYAAAAAVPVDDRVAALPITDVAPFSPGAVDGSEPLW